MVDERGENGLAVVKVVIVWQSGCSSRSQKTVWYRAKGRSHCKRKRQGTRGLTRMSDIIKTQRSLALKAKHNPTHQFDHLYRRICQQEWIQQALNLVLSNQGARTAGIDGVTKKDARLVRGVHRIHTGTATRASREALSSSPSAPHLYPKIQGQHASTRHPYLERSSRPNVAQDGVRTHLGKRLPELLQRLSPWTRNNGLYRSPGQLHQQPHQVLLGD